jgi:hypothetical protein
MKIDTSRVVKVYRKLAGKGYRKGRVLYSIVQDGRVRAVRERVILANVRFKVSEAGRQRVLKSGHKNVHAFAVGYLVSSEFTSGSQISGCMGIDENGNDLPIKVRYNPYKYRFFYTTNMCDQDVAIRNAGGVLFNERGVTAAYIS